MFRKKVIIQPGRPLSYEYESDLCMCAWSVIAVGSIEILLNHNNNNRILKRVVNTDRTKYKYVRAKIRYSNAYIPSDLFILSQGTSVV